MESERPQTSLTASQRRRLYAREARRRKRRRRLLVGLVAGLAVGGAIIGYFAVGGSSSEDATRQPESRPPTTTVAHRTTTAAQRPVPRPAPRPLFTPPDRADFASLERRLGGASGVAVSGIGLGRPVSELGTLREGVAWSTIKVPIAVAIEARFGGAPPPATQDLLTRAITASDNAAAEGLWSTLGPPDMAGAAVQRVLASTGDTSTKVETRVLRPGFTSFGQTVWPLASQQRFIAGLSCLAHTQPVLALMHEIESDQRWGLGTLGTGTSFKGGWGPDPTGRYLVRQMGIVRLPNGRLVAASIATIPSDGSFGTGTANLGAIAQWLASHVNGAAVPAARC